MPWWGWLVISAYGLFFLACVFLTAMLQEDMEPRNPDL